MNKHWTERSAKDFVFRIATDFIAQLEDRMEDLGLSQDELAKMMEKSKGRISQIINNPGNMRLETAVEYSRALKMKVALVAYDDNDPTNRKGPINSDIFRICWEKANKPQNFWAFQSANEQLSDSMLHTTLPLEEAAKRDVIIDQEEVDRTAGLAMPALASASNY